MKRVWVAEQVCLRPLSTAWLVPRATKCLCEEPHQSPYSVHLCLVFSSSKSSECSPSLFLRDSSVFLMPAEYSWLCRRRLVVLVSFLTITHEVERVSDFAPDFEFDLQSPDDIPGLLILKLVQPWPVSRCYLSCRTWKAAYFLVVFYHRLHTLSQEFQEVW